MNLKYATIFTLCFIVLGCRSSTDFDYEKSATQNFIKSDGVLFILNIYQSNYMFEDSLNIKFEVKNISVVQKSFFFNNQQQFGFNLTDEFNHVAMSYPQGVQPATSRFTLNPGQTKIFKFSGQFKDHEGNYIDKGNYRLSTFLLGNYPEVYLNLIIN